MKINLITYLLKWYKRMTICEKCEISDLRGVAFRPARACSRAGCRTSWVVRRRPRTSGACLEPRRHPAACACAAAAAPPACRPPRRPPRTRPPRPPRPPPRPPTSAATPRPGTVADQTCLLFYRLLLYEIRLSETIYITDIHRINLVCLKLSQYE